MAATTGIATPSSKADDHEGKLTLAEINQLSETERKVYLYSELNQNANTFVF